MGKFTEYFNDVIDDSVLIFTVKDLMLRLQNLLVFIICMNTKKRVCVCVFVSRSGAAVAAGY